MLRVVIDTNVLLVSISPKSPNHSVTLMIINSLTVQLLQMQNLSLVKITTFVFWSKLNFQRWILLALRSLKANWKSSI
jgi:hypothetical protein